LSARRLRVRLSLGLLLVVAVVWISARDSHSEFRIGSLIAAALGAVALVEYTRIVPRSAAGQAALFAGCAVLFWRTLSELVNARGPHPGLFCVWFGLACAAPILAAIVSRRTTQVVPEDARNLAFALLGLLLVVFPMLCLIEIGYLVPGRGFLPRPCAFLADASRPISEKGIGPWFLLTTIFTCKLNDIGGYLVGSFVGRTRLAPAISPKKSVEGSVAGLTLGVLGAWSAFYWFCPTAGVLSQLHAVLFGVVLSVATQASDLCESLIKRAAGVKDSGTILPAFGGILDLVDSFILAAPAGYTLLWLWTA
jgi:CDP-diglyceride synthetase